MPTFTALALDTLLEPGGSKSVDKSVPYSKSVSNAKPVPNSKLERRNSASVAEKRVRRPPITPALYATPEATPLPDSPTSFPPSPYIINHKRRGPRLQKSFSEANVMSKQKDQNEDIKGYAKDTETKVSNSMENNSVIFTVAEPFEENGVNGVSDCSSSNGKLGNGKVVLESSNGKVGSSNGLPGYNKVKLGGSIKWNGLAVEAESTNQVALFSERDKRDSEREDFFDPQESMSIASNTDGEDNVDAERSLPLTTPQAEFFDAWDELSSESGQQSSLRDFEAELSEMRLSLLMEIEKRKQAEEALSEMRNQWQRIRQQLSLVGLTLPSDAAIIEAREQLDSDPAEELCRQVYVARFVSTSIGRSLARAELETKLEAQIESKNFEIARLWDKLHNYEAMNQEMVQRNQDVIEMARQERERRKRRQRWVWGSIATTLTLGTAALIWSYHSSGAGISANDSQLPQSDDAGK
ncbi:uncharacterized protein LOC107424689 [Ziziphus jujuba]|uniref:Uncharacterized protein LOC107424689 n=1 Tax=Ziziphus jujuba TaxID=326968 RepID=A0A6P4A716_ZIZJJ|nr:uncharacterized protein LOC107424689 [Ziziphus jujuba]XP_015890026.2 uncharacterized protein LOC107424689 [Ziziphus jujuba]XP_015890027.2 uncharacterized protein LOC107424689 [Ziziphus jujuba]